MLAQAGVIEVVAPKSYYTIIINLLQTIVTVPSILLTGNNLN